MVGEDEDWLAMLRCRIAWWWVDGSWLFYEPVSVCYDLETRDLEVVLRMS